MLSPRQSDIAGAPNDKEDATYEGVDSPQLYNSRRSALVGRHRVKQRIEALRQFHLNARELTIKVPDRSPDDQRDNRSHSRMKAIRWIEPSRPASHIAILHVPSRSCVRSDCFSIYLQEKSVNCKIEKGFHRYSISNPEHLGNGRAIPGASLIVHIFIEVFQLSS